MAESEANIQLVCSFRLEHCAGAVGRTDGLKNVCGSCLQELICTLTQKCSNRYCSKQSSHFCEECNIHICRTCAESHARAEATPGHHIVEVCKEYSQPFDKYCKTCEQPVCAASHKDEAHCVISLEDAFKDCNELRRETLRALIKLRERLGAVDDQAIGFRKAVDKKVGAQIQKVTSRARVTSASGTCVLADLNLKKENVSEEIQECRGRLEELNKQQMGIENTICKVQSELDSTNSSKEQCLNQLKNDQARCHKEISDMQRNAEDSIPKVESAIDSSDIALSTVLKDSTSLNALKESKGQLQQLHDVTENTLSEMQRVEETVAEFVPSKDAIEFGFLRRRHFTVATQVADLSIPADVPCRHVFAATHLPNGTVVALGHSGGDNRGDILYRWDPNDHADTCQVITDGVKPARDVVAVSDDEVVVLRSDHPTLRFFNLQDGSIKRDVDALPGGYVPNESRYLALDSSGTVFIGYGNPTRQLLAVQGNAVEIVAEDIGVGREMSYSVSRRILNVAVGGGIARYRLNALNTAQEIQTNVASVDGFKSWDVCASPSGEVFVTGYMEQTKEIKLFQFIEQHNGEFELKNIRLENEMGRNLPPPHVSVNDRQLVLGAGSMLQLLNLS